jgi:arylsulfatase A-like enzyme
LCLALAAGLTETALLALRKLIWGEFLLRSLQTVWMSPLAYLIVLAPLAALLTVLARAFPPISAPIQVGVLTFVAALGALLTVVSRFHVAAIALVALGLAVQAGRWVAAHPEQAQRGARRGTFWLIGAVGVLAAAVNLFEHVTERRAVAALGPARAGLPNILLLILDTVRARNLSLYGYHRPTSPALERLADRGVRFDVAISTAPWTLPSHVSLFTGHYPHRTSTRDWGTPLDGAHATLAEVLGESGYLTGAFMANHRYSRHEGGLARGFSRYEDYETWSLGQVLMSSSLIAHLYSREVLQRLFRVEQRPGRRSAKEVNDAFLAWLPRTGERPFFAFLNYMDAHQPYIPPEPFRGRFSRQPRRSLGERILGRLQPSRPRPAPLPWVERQIDAYDGSIAYLDSQIGVLMDSLEARGVLHNTIVLLAADHGEEFGGRGFFGHGQSVSLQAVHVPLVVSWPGHVPEGASVAKAVTLRSIPATVMDLLGLADESPFPGVSLAGAWRDRTYGDTAAAMLSARGRDRKRSYEWSLTHSRWHYVQGHDGRHHLFSVKTGLPDTSVSSPGVIQVIDRLREVLEGLRGNGGAPSTGARLRATRPRLSVARTSLQD